MHSGQIFNISGTALSANCYFEQARAWSSQAAAVRVSLPVPLASGVFPATLEVLAKDGSMLRLPWNLSVEREAVWVADARPAVVPREGGGAVDLKVVGLPAATVEQVAVTLGGTPCLLRGPPVFESGDGVGVTYMSISLPSHPAGAALLEVVWVPLDGDIDAVRVDTMVAVEGSDARMACRESCMLVAGAVGPQEVMLLLDTALPHIWQSHATNLSCVFETFNASSNHLSSLCQVVNHSMGPFSPCPGKGAASATTRWCANVTAALTIHSPAAAPPAGESPPLVTVLLLRVVAAAEPAAVALTARRQPRLVSAVLGDSLAWIDATFDQDMTFSGPPCCSCGAALDAEWLTTAAVAGGALGDGVVCQWTSATRLRVLLGSGADPRPSDRLVVAAALVSRAGGAAMDPAAREALVDAPQRRVPQPPTLEAPAEAGPCDAAKLRAKPAVSRAAVTWSCANDADLNELLRNQSVGTEAEIPVTFLAAGRSLRVRARAGGAWSAGQSDAAEAVVVGRRRAFAAVSVGLPASPLLPTQLQGLAVNVIQPSCDPDDSLVVQWTIFGYETSARRSPPSESPLSRARARAAIAESVVVEGTGTAVDVASGVLQAGQAYELVVAAVGANGVTQVSRTFTVASQELVVLVDGGDRQAAVDEAVTLDASRSYDPDACPTLYAAAAACDSGLAFAWTCSRAADGSPCRLANLSLASWPTAPRVSIVPASLAAASGDVLLVEAIASKGSRQDSHRVSLVLGSAVDAATAVAVHVVELYAAADAAAWRAVVGDGNEDAEYHWWVTEDASGHDVELVRPALRTGVSGRMFALQLDDPSALAVLQIGVNYRVTVVATTANRTRTGRAWTVLQLRPIPPYGGSCTSSPATGAALTTSFDVRCAGWSAARPPLAYRFALAVGDLAKPPDDVLWTPSSPDPRLQLYLAEEGVTTLFARIDDASGSSTLFRAGTVNASGGGAASGGDQAKLLALSAVVERLARVGAIGPLLALVDAAAQSVNKVAGQRCGGACRRLLASSATYRMAVRRLLLRTLSGSPLQAVNTRTAPAMLRSVRRLAQVPVELDSSATAAAERLFGGGSSLVSAQALRGGTLQDVVRLASGLLAAWRASLNSAEQGERQAGLLRGLLDYAAALAASRLEGEIPWSAVWEDLFVQLAPPQADPQQLANQTFPTVSGTPGVGTLAVVRALPGLPREGAVASVQSGGGSLGMLASDLVGVRWLSGLAGRRVATLCTVNDCLRVDIGVAWPDGLTPGLAVGRCLRWSEGLGIWEASVCRVARLDAPADGGSDGVVACACSSDGVFSAVVERAATATPARPVPLSTVAMNRRPASWPAISFLIAALVVLSILALLKAWEVSDYLVVADETFVRRCELNARRAALTRAALRSDGGPPRGKEPRSDPLAAARGFLAQFDWPIRPVKTARPPRRKSVLNGRSHARSNERGLLVEFVLAPPPPPSTMSPSAGPFEPPSPPPSTPPPPPPRKQVVLFRPPSPPAAPAIELQPPSPPRSPPPSPPLPQPSSTHWLLSTPSGSPVPRRRRRLQSQSDAYDEAPTQKVDTSDRPPPLAPPSLWAADIGAIGEENVFSRRGLQSDEREDVALTGEGRGGIVGWGWSESASGVRRWPQLPPSLATPTGATSLKSRRALFDENPGLWKATA